MCTTILNPLLLAALAAAALLLSLAADADTTPYQLVAFHTQQPQVEMDLPIHLGQFTSYEMRCGQQKLVQGTPQRAMGLGKWAGRIYVAADHPRRVRLVLLNPSRGDVCPLNWEAYAGSAPIVKSLVYLHWSRYLDPPQVDYAGYYTTEQGQEGRALLCQQTGPFDGMTWNGQEPESGLAVPLTNDQGTRVASVLFVPELQAQLECQVTRGQRQWTQTEAEVPCRDRPGKITNCVICPSVRASRCQPRPRPQVRTRRSTEEEEPPSSSTVLVNCVGLWVVATTLPLILLPLTVHFYPR